jgi:hypothetical protein
MSRIWNAISWLLVAITVAFLFTRHRTLAEVRNQNISARLQMEQLQHLHAENERQSKSVPIANLTSEEFRELLRLRGEIGTLRSQLAETPVLGGKHEANPWSYAGADTPEAALETLLWALSNTNFNGATGLFHFEISGLITPTTRKQIMYWLTEDPGSHIRWDMMVHWITNLQSLEIFSAVPDESQDVLLKLWETTFDGNKRKVAAKVRRVNNEWKFLAKGVVLGTNRIGDAAGSRTFLPFTSGEEWPPPDPPQTSKTQSQ